MIKKTRIIEDIKNIVAKVVEEVLDEYRSDHLRQETDMTASLLFKLKERLQFDLGAVKVRFEALHIPDHGPGAMESTLGADMAGFIRIQLAGYTVRKGVLIQAKKAIEKPAQPQTPLLGKTALQTLSAQCADMIRHSPASFVLIQHSARIDILPAVSFTAGSNELGWGFPGNVPILDYVYSKTIPDFFAELLQSFLGDTRLGSNVSNLKELETFMERHGAKDGFILDVKSDRPAGTKVGSEEELQQIELSRNVLAFSKRQRVPVHTWQLADPREEVQIRLR